MLTRLAFALLVLGLPPNQALAADPAELQQIRLEINQLKQSYDSRIKNLEERLRRAEAKASEAEASAAEAQAALQSQAAPAPLARPTVLPAGTTPGANAFNPEISLILSGLYSNLSKDPSSYRIANFIPGGEIGPGKRGFSLSESELGIYANADPWFYGGLNLAIHPDDTVSAEEAFIQTTTLPYGLKVKAGRFFSGIGYLNEQHAHTWDFVDAPLAYQAFLGTQYGQEGAQIKWLAPTDTYLEFGAELGSGESFPGSSLNRNGAGAAALFAHAGGDVGLSNSWRTGISWLHADPRDRQFEDLNTAGQTVSDSFSGRSNLWLADFVWKWAPNGNAQRTNFKLQGEYFYRRENGSLSFDTAAANLTDGYFSAQSGWYLQSVYQFMPTWRVGVRYDQLYNGDVDLGSNELNFTDSGANPSKAAVMLDWTPSEFSRIRLQLADDKSSRNSRADGSDWQFFLQYQMSLGAHGAHNF